MAPSHRRGPWVPEEDQALLQLVREQGPNNWVRISQHMHFRSPKQCRERFHQNLKPSLNHAPISAEEGMMIERMVNEMGKRWAEIARRLGNRSDNAVKNWWNGSMNRKRRGMVVQTAHPSRTCNGRVEAPYPRASSTNGHMRRSSWGLVKDADDSSRPLAPIFSYPANHPVEPAMTSPAFSEASSLEPPSMVSDHNSVSSASPRTASSPQMLPLPVNVRQAYAERRGSAPVFHFPSAAGPIPDEILSGNSSDLLKRWGPDGQTLPFKTSGHHHSNSLPDASLTPQENSSDSSQRSSRDTRMGLDSLLN